MNIKLLDQINYHDAEIYNYKRDDKNISFELKDGWNNDSYYKFELKNVMVQVMNNKSEYINYVLDEFNNINKNGHINLYSGECCLLDEPIDGCKYYLKLWIRHPNDLGIKTGVLLNEYKFDGMDITLCDDYDDTGRLYIKFIVEDINIIELYPLLKKYSRNSKDNMNNLYKYKDKFGEKEFKFFSVLSTGFYVYYDLEYVANNICIICKNMLDLSDGFTIKFLNITDKLDRDEINTFINNMMEKNVNYFECIRIIKCINDKYVVGFLKSNDDEIVFTCNEIVYDGNLLDTRSVLDLK